MHYLPHHEVIRKNRESTSVRIVYDGSAKSPGQQLSLNDCLPTGPNYIPQLADVLVRFHWNRIAITADIEKAFLYDWHTRESEKHTSVPMVERPVSC